MLESAREYLSRQRAKIFGAGALLLFFWVAFLDSHSLFKRVKWSYEAEQLRTENAEIQADIDRLEAELERELTDDEVERIAREEYGMQREGETVHPVTPGE
ncbi:MAG: septum formation initiator family protein [Rhodothermales bacterium]|nr:septum formation initiator family protein [Rhodothermales bacterium]MBO6779834.1 septum formation initiator family protein [Rhodothermales bacterium]